MFLKRIYLNETVRDNAFFKAKKEKALIRHVLNFQKLS